jgi:hypothetical protein
VTADLVIVLAILAGACLIFRLLLTREDRRLLRRDLRMVGRWWWRTVTRRRVSIQRPATVAGPAAAKHVSPPRSFDLPAAKGFQRANAQQLADALDDIGGTRLVGRVVVPGPWRIQ